jgi:hypothetical protein
MGVDIKWFRLEKFYSDEFTGFFQLDSFTQYIYILVLCTLGQGTIQN